MSSPKTSGRTQQVRAVAVVIERIADVDDAGVILAALFQPPRRGRNAKEPRHGTRGGYQRHLRNGEQACSDCRKAAAEYAAAQRGGSHTRPLLPCGTPGAYQRHKKNGETPCEACRVAYNDHHLLLMREWRARQRRKVAA